MPSDASIQPVVSVASWEDQPIDSGPMSILTPGEQAILFQSLLTVPDFPQVLELDHAKIGQRMKLSPRTIANGLSIIKGKFAKFDIRFRRENKIPNIEEEGALEGASGATVAAATEAAGEDDGNTDENANPKKRIYQKPVALSAPVTLVAPAEPVDPAASVVLAPSVASIAPEPDVHATSPGAGDVYPVSLNIAQLQSIIDTVTGNVLTKSSIEESSDSSPQYAPT
ncbi:uncharacterized protein C8A04DRAFT_30950 [Dichotomopilus funicola]|uniref:Uncharacterized protein n=1 Tax=Dichotomopilus funicola TaxID=1934379 RepID=A0AAN6UYB9_9PEZI|nr:hypothetical protein C8A04DRAFT_30950 [Dichotomopilus funicola]